MTIYRPAQLDPQQIKAIIFDLDGTLYVSEPFEQAVWHSVTRYVGDLLSLPPEAAAATLSATRRRLSEERQTLQTLAATIEALGGTVQELHHRFAAELHPEQLIEPDPRVAPLLQALQQRYTSWLLTNNNRTLTDRIMGRLGVQDCFERVITINDTWRPKPDDTVLDELLDGLALPAETVLFVGDRYDIDLRLPQLRGCPVLLTRTPDELLLLDQLL